MLSRAQPALGPARSRQQSHCRRSARRGYLALREWEEPGFAFEVSLASCWAKAYARAGLSRRFVSSAPYRACSPTRRGLLALQGVLRGHRGDQPSQLLGLGLAATPVIEPARECAIIECVPIWVASAPFIDSAPALSRHILSRSPAGLNFSLGPAVVRRLLCVTHSSKFQEPCCHSIKDPQTLCLSGS